MSNSHSLSVVPVFYQNLGDNLPVFAQTTDAIHFKNVADSLEIAYPQSKYVKALRAEAEKRMQYLELEARLMNAEQRAYPEIELPDLQAQKRKLSEVDSKVVMVLFWTATNAEQKMFNLDVLKPIYEQFHGKGFEIYQVSLDVDKGLWARVVKEQGLPWINVCDTRSAASPFAAAYNIPALPAAFIIANGELVDGKVVDEASLRKLLRKLL
jgi:peroxiredoxin